MDIGPKGISFDRGIDRIIPAGERPRERLPTEGRLPPSETPALQRLDQLVKVPTIDAALRGDLMPNISDRSQLTPGNFSRNLAEALTTLELAATAQPEHERTLREAVAVLRDEAALRELVDHYRSVLYRG